MRLISKRPKAVKLGTGEFSFYRSILISTQQVLLRIMLPDRATMLPKMLHVAIAGIIIGI